MINNHTTVEQEEKSLNRFCNTYYRHWGDPGGGRAGLKSIFASVKDYPIEEVIKALDKIANGDFYVRGKPLMNEIKEALDKNSQSKTENMQLQKPQKECQYCFGIGLVDHLVNTKTNQLISRDSAPIRRSQIVLNSSGRCSCAGGAHEDFIWSLEQIQEFISRCETKTKEELA